MRAFLVLCLASCASAWQAMLMTGSANSRVSTVQMKHPKYFERVQRAESGRLRLSVYR